MPRNETLPTSGYQAGRAIPFSTLFEQPPTSHGGAKAWLMSFTLHIPTAKEFSRLLERMESEGLLTSEEASSHANRAIPDSVAELAAKVRALDAIAEAHRTVEIS